jgi:hypothetical protein
MNATRTKSAAKVESPPVHDFERERADLKAGKHGNALEQDYDFEAIENGFGTLDRVNFWMLPQARAMVIGALALLPDEAAVDDLSRIVPVHSPGFGFLHKIASIKLLLKGVSSELEESAEAIDEAVGYVRDALHLKTPEQGVN